MTASRLPASWSVAVRSARRWNRFCPPATLSSSLSTRSIRLARVSPTTSTPASTSATGISTASASRSRLRRLIAGTRRGVAIGLGGFVGAQDVAEPADRAEQPRLRVLQLASQVADVRLDDVVLAVEVVLPDVVEDLLLGQDALGVEEEVAEQAELGGGELDLVARAPDLVAVLVQLQVAVAQPRRSVAVVSAPDAAQEGGDPERELLEREGLGDIVVTAAYEARDAVVLGVARGEEDHRDEIARGAQPAAHFEAVDVGEHDVEHDEVGGGVGRGVEGRVPGRRGGDLVPEVAEGRRQEVRDGGLVVDDEDVGRSAHAATVDSVPDGVLVACR